MAAHANWKGFRLGADPIGLVRFRAARLDLELFRAGSSGLDAPQAIASPFDRLFPEWALYPMVILATETTAIASQVVISGGAFSLSQQGMQLRLLPRLDVQQTSPVESAQIAYSAFSNDF
jgi:K+ transporter